jgi:hypothetical protein
VVGQLLAWARTLRICALSSRTHASRITKYDSGLGAQRFHFCPSGRPRLGWEILSDRFGQTDGGVKQTLGS